MRKYIVFVPLVIMILLAQFVSGQNIPNYTITHFDSASTGYYFICPFKLGIIPGGVYQNHMILDSTGRLVYFKSIPNGTNTSDFKMQPNGMITYSFQGQHFIMDSTFSIIDSVSFTNGITTDVHDFQILPNGHYLILGIETLVLDLSAYPYFGPNGNVPGSNNAHVKCGVIQEQDAAKNVVFDWHSYNHFSFNDVDTALLGSPNSVDWTHCNSVALDTDGNILLSSRHFNEVTKINRQNGAIMWRFGGNANQFTFLNDTMQFKRQHDARRLPNGNLTLFDNGNGMASGSFHYASAKEYQLDETAMTAQLVWSYVDDSSEFSAAMGNFQRVPGGNSTIGYGMSDTQNKMFSAVDDAGNKVFQMEFDLALTSYRAFNYHELPWKLNRPEIFCFENNGQLFLDAGAGYASYLWSNGDTTQITQVTASDTFYVFIPYGDGGYLSSEWLYIDNPLTFCSPSSDGVLNNEIKAFVVSPVRDEIEVYFNTSNYLNKQIHLSDISGKSLLTLNVSNQASVKIPSGDLAPGLYFIRIDNSVFKILKY